MNALDLAATKIYFSANNIAANPSFLSEGNYVNITEQYKGMSFNFNSIVVLRLPHSTHLSLKVLSPLSLRTAGCPAGNTTVLHILSQLYTLT